MLYLLRKAVAFQVPMVEPWLIKHGKRREVKWRTASVGAGKRQMCV